MALADGRSAECVARDSRMAFAGMTSRFGAMSLIPDSQPGIAVVFHNHRELLAWRFIVHQPAALDLLGVGEGQRAATAAAIFGDPLMGDVLCLARGHRRDAAGKQDGNDGCAPAEEAPERGRKTAVAACERERILQAATRQKNKVTCAG